MNATVQAALKTAFLIANEDICNEMSSKYNMKYIFCTTTQ